VKKIWEYISFLGIKDRNLTLENRTLILTNRINFSMLVAIILLISINIYRSFILDLGPSRMGNVFLIIQVGVNFLSLFLCYYGYFRIVKLALTFLPVSVLIILPAIVGSVESQDFTDYPLAILALSLVPQILFMHKQESVSYYVSLSFLLFVLIFNYDLLVYFSPVPLEIADQILKFRFFFTLIPLIVYVFIHVTIKYLRDLNFSSEQELWKKNEELNATIVNLEVTQRQLFHAEKMAALGTLTAGVAHEINNPLNFIHAGTECIENYFDENIIEHKEKISPFVSAIQDGIKRVSAIVSNLKHFELKDDLQHGFCDINSILENCLSILHSNFSENIVLTKEYAREEYALKGNERKLHQAFLNVLTNAGQAILKSGHIQISTQLKDSHLVTTIRDTGTGISRENLSQVFNPFFTTKREGLGTGLGLTVSYNIIQEHRGFIQIASEEGKGTTATIGIPVTPK
jgi:signal transduction histidine kinase